MLIKAAGTVIIAVATSSKQLKVVRATIQWGLPQSDKQVPHGSVPLNPTLRQKRIAVTSWFQHGPSQSHLDTSMAQLSHMEVLPSALEGAPVGSAPSLSSPLLLTVRSHAAAEHSPYNQDQQSIVDRWEILNEQPQSLHSAFEQLGSRATQGSNLPVSSPQRFSPDNTNAGPQKMSRLRKLDSIVIPKIIISIHPMQLGQVICFAFSDGTVQYRHRLTMNEIYNEPNIHKIMTLGQVGFQFAEESPCTL